MFIAISPEKGRRNGMGGFLLPATDDPRARGAADVPRQRAGRAAGVGHGAAPGAAGAGVQQLARLAPARARAAPHRAALRGRRARLLLATTH